VSSPLPYICGSPPCQQRRWLEPDTIIAYYEGPDEPCVYCGQKGFLRLGVVTHLIQPDPNGIIHGVDIGGVPTGVRWEFLCERSYRGYRAAPNSPQHPKSFTAVPSSATCHECLLEFGKRTISSRLTA
jgi:hypothetical protein